MRRYHVTTFGCQMNVHDAERIRGLLEDAGLGEAPSREAADVIVFNTCTIREKADGRFVQHLLEAGALKRREPGKQIVVGGCYAESVKDELFRQFPFVDYAFGPGAIPSVRGFVDGSSDARGAFGTFEQFAGDLPARRERPFQGWLQISMGCNSVCSYCIVPSVRGREQSRPWTALVEEARAMVADGVAEITLLGQNVNSYGRDLPVAERISFAGLLRELDAIEGLSRIRYTSPHPKDFRPDVIAAIAECDAVCEHMHLPLQSGSTEILRRMRRTYSADRYLELVERVRAAVPGIALTTDVIVGFPGETEVDFQATLDVYDAVGFDHAFTFIYSPRHGTEAAAMDGQIDEDEKRDRLERLVEVVQRHAHARNQALVGTVADVLVEGPSRTDPTTVRGRTRSNKTVIVEPAVGAGTLVDVRIDEATSQTLRGTALAAVRT